MARRDDDSDVFPSDLPSIPRMRKNASSSTKAAQPNVGLKRKVSSQSPRSDGGGDDVPRRERKKRFAPAPSSRGRATLKEASPSRSMRSESDGSDADEERDACDEEPSSQSRGRSPRRAEGGKKIDLKGDSDSNSEERADEGAGPVAVERERSSSEEINRTPGKHKGGSRRKMLARGGSSRSSPSPVAVPDDDEDAILSPGLGKAEDAEIGEQSASDASSDSDSNNAIEAGRRGQKLDPLSLDGDEKALDDYSEDESIGSEGEAVGRPGDSSQRLTVRQRAMQGEDLGTELRTLASPKHKKKRKPPPEDLTKDEEKAIKLQQKARLRHMVHEKRNKEKRAAMVDKVLRGVTSKRKKLSLAAETYVAQAGARLAKDSVRDDCYRYTSKREGSYVSIPAAMNAPRILDVPRRANAYPRKCERDPKTGKRILS